MPLPVLLIPLVLKGAAAVAGTIGVGAAIRGGVKMKEVQKVMASVEAQHEADSEKFRITERKAGVELDKLGELELRILDSFKEFQDVFEQIKNRPVFEPYSKNGITLPKYDGEKIEEVSVGAGVLIGGIGGAGLGTLGGIAAAGAATAVVTTFATASTGTAIASLSEGAATNATLAALGGGALAAGGGGIVGGTLAWGAATLGVGVLVGGLIFNYTGKRLSDKADEAMNQMLEAKEKIDKACSRLEDLINISNRFRTSLCKVNKVYEKHLEGLKAIVTLLGHKDWNTFTDEEKRVTENTVLLVGLLYNMCKVELVVKAEREDEMNIINSDSVETSMNQAERILEEQFGGATA